MASKTKKSAKKTICSICKNEIIFPCDVFKDNGKTICRHCHDKKDAKRRKKLLKSKLSSAFSPDFTLFTMHSIRNVAFHVKRWMEVEEPCNKKILEQMLEYLNNTIISMNADVETIAKENNCLGWLNVNKRRIQELTKV